MGKPALTFNPCDYGDAYTKKTDLWGRFNEPRKKPVEVSAEMKALCAVNNRPLPSGVKGNATRRAMTPAGFANAFFKANK